MISKPLFKQSGKANAWTWFFVTLATCLTLAIIILVLGTLNVSEIKDAMAKMFIEDTIESSIEQQSMTFYNMADNSLKSYDANFDMLKALLQNQISDIEKSAIILNYNNLISAGADDQTARQTLCEGQAEEKIMAINALLDYYLVQGEDYSDAKISEYILNKIADGLYNELREILGEQDAANAKQFVSAAIQNYVLSGSANTTEFATAYIPNVLKGIFYNTVISEDEQTIRVSDYFTEEKLHNLSYTSIITFRAQLTIKENQIREELSQEENYENLTEQEIETIVMARLLEYVDEIIADLSESLMSQMPAKIQDSLNEINDMDLSNLVIGNIFYKIAGLLLPMIYIIMVANNLIAGQVDSGSMAYILSTPIKRRKVTVTQITYLVTSLFAMFALTTITSVCCLFFVGGDKLTITYSDLLLLNLGAFLTMFAVSGICFLASSWFNRSKKSMGVGGGVTMMFLVATILGLFGSQTFPQAMRIDSMNLFNYFSVISLFDVNSILGGSLTFLWKWTILIAIGVVTYIIGIIKFDKKDLSL